MLDVTHINYPGNIKTTINMPNLTRLWTNQLSAIVMMCKSLRVMQIMFCIPLLGSPIGVQAALGTACLNAPTLSAPTGNIVNVSNDSQLQSAISNLSDGTTIVLEPGDYKLSNTLYIQRNNVTITGATSSCDDVVLIGNGMDNSSYASVPHGIWTNAQNLNVYNLTIRDVYQHSIMFNPGAQSPHVYNVKLLDSGEQFVKSNPTGFGDGVDNGKIEYTIMEYTGAPTNHSGNSGYTNGVDVHAGENWVVRNNLFKNFHTPDSSDWWWNPAVLVWNGAAGTITEGNSFINVDRAVAYGLVDRSGSDHTGGVIRNNMVFYSTDLYSSSRTTDSDGAIIVWDSPQTKVLHNTIITNGNLNDAIQLRFSPLGVVIKNNLLDGTIHARNGVQFVDQGNVTNATSDLFVDPSNGDLHLKSTATIAIDQGDLLVDAVTDIDGTSRQDGASDIGADEYSVGSTLSVPLPPSNITVM